MTNCTKEAQNDVVKTQNDAINLIRRADAINVIRKNHYRLQGKGMTEEVLIADLEALPSTEPPYQYSEAYVRQIRGERDILQDMVDNMTEPKTGKWILSDNQSREDMENGNYYYICSNCLHGDVHAKTQEVPYCWHCGSYNGGK